ncbi:hypothetical protein GCM10009809_31430 [Isoptericola hypogeus]|uniref:D-alanyl-D-alanine carboxypeptidase-like core domain-containing protein n=1 Tax=Isoptericola hypogeus TaxID=300179 RepID=A0ABN2JNL5_9MICO
MTRTPRTASALLAVVVVLAGLGGRTVLSPEIGGPLGDALFATLVVLLVALVRPRTTPVVATVVGLAVCAAIELSHLTDVPAQVLERLPAARYALGTTFGASDLAWYALGAVVGGALLAVVTPRPRVVDLSLRHGRVPHAPRRRARFAVPVVLGTALLVATGGVGWFVWTESQDLTAQVAVAQDALDDSAGRVADDAVRTDLAAAIDDADALLGSTPVLGRLPGDAARAREELERDTAGVERSRLAFALAEASVARDALGPVTRRAERVLAATDELAEAGQGAAEADRSAVRDALATADEALDAARSDRLEAEDATGVEGAAASLAAGRDELDTATTNLMTAQDAVVCPEPDQVWFPQAGKLAADRLAPIPWAPEHAVRADVLDDLVALDEAYLAQFGEHLTVNSAYRDLAQQVEVYNPDDPNPLAAPPGCSNHGLGTAVDLSMGPEGFDSPRYAWLKEHAEQHGWTHPDWAEPGGRLPEPWHWQSVGTPVEY